MPWISTCWSARGLGSPGHHAQRHGPALVHIPQQGAAVFHHDSRRLAVLTEILTMRSSPSRPVSADQPGRAVTPAAEGANFVEGVHYLRANDMSEDDSYAIAVRIFRGHCRAGRPLPLTWPICGFIQTYNFMRSI